MTLPHMLEEMGAQGQLEAQIPDKAAVPGTEAGGRTTRAALWQWWVAAGLLEWGHCLEV